jgi:plastocyanin
VDKSTRIAPRSNRFNQNEVAIPEGAFDPSATLTYFPRDLIVEVGTTVTWRSDNSVIHTVTSGTSNDSVRETDGLFDSGSIGTGETF